MRAPITTSALHLAIRTGSTIPEWGSVVGAEVG